MSPILRYSLNFGLLWGVIIVLSDLIFEVFPFSLVWVNAFKLGLIILSMYLFIRYYRNKVNGGFLSMPEALRLGFNTGAAAGVIAGFLSFLALTYGPQELTDKLMRDLFSGQSFTAEEKEKFYEGLHSPFNLAMSSSFLLAIIGFVTSLVFGFMLRKEKTIFKNKIEE